MARSVYRVDKNSKYARRRRKKRWPAFVLAVVVLLALSYLITKLLEGGFFEDANSGSDSSASGVASTAENDGYRYVFKEPSGKKTSYWTLPETVEDTLHWTMLHASAKMLALPENGKVLDAYFDGVTFVGDSITQGMQQYNIFPGANYCAFKGAGPQAFLEGAVQTLPDGTTANPLDLIAAAGSRRIYVLLGTNAMVYMSDEALLTYYNQFMDQLKARMPASEIYIQSITPTTAEKGADSHFALSRIALLNDQIAGMAFNHGFHYLDINGVLSDETGYARADLIYASDGYHFKPSGYAVWGDYLRTHVAHAPDVQYSYGSPLYYGPADN